MDRVLFIGSRMPHELARALPLLRTADRQAVRVLLQYTLAYLQNQVADDTSLQAQRPADVPAEKWSEMFSGLLVLLTCAFRQPGLKQSTLQEDLKDLKLSPELISDFCKAWEPNRERLAALLAKNAVALPSLQDFRWRVDVAISTSAVSQALKPTIHFQMTLSDGSIQQFEVPLAQFHRLRYSVALMLKDADIIKSKNIFKIKD